MAREVLLNGKRYWILSAPHDDGWTARVVEVWEGGEMGDIGIEATAPTRTAADAAAEQKLYRLLSV